MTATGFSSVLAEQARRRPGHMAVVDGHRRLTYAELDHLVDGVAAGLQGSGVGPGDVVSSQLPNGLESVALLYAAGRVGAVHNPISPVLGRRETEFIRAQAASAVFVTSDDELCVSGERRPVPAPRPVGTDAGSVLLYTSGTTAEPKGVRHSDRTLLAECAAMALFYGLGPEDTFVVPSPVAHVSGLIYGILMPVFAGGTSVLMAAWDPTRFLELVESERGTFSAGATPFLQGIVEHPHLDRHDHSSLRLFPCGGAKVPPQLIDEAVRRLGVRTGRGYGSTEFPSITSSAGPDDPLVKRAGTDGRPIGANEVVLRDGEVLARGPELFLGYQDPALDAEAFDEEGFFRTGDLGAIDEDGYLTIVGRTKDIVVRSGEKFSTREIEDIILEHPKVADVAVVAVPDARLGEQACAFVVPRGTGGPPTITELTELFAARGVSRRKVPERLEVVDHLPMTASGKVQKHVLQERVR